MTEETSLAELRKETAKITLEIIRLCGERFQLAKRIGEIKARENLPIESPKIEEDLRNKVLSRCQMYGIDRRFCLKLLEFLLDESKRIQKDLSEQRSKKNARCQEA